MALSTHDETRQLAADAAARLSRPAPIKAAVGVVVRGERWVAGGADDDIYEIGSITKAFTTTLLSAMVEEGTVRLDDPAGTHFPDMRLDERITLAHLATHTSGLPRVPRALLKDMDRTNPYARFDEAALIACLDGIKLSRPPGQRHQYSNLGAAVLGQVLAHRAGRPFDALVEQQLCAPLGLVDTTIALSASQEERLAPALTKRGKPASHWDLASFAPAGALTSTARDLLNFIVAQTDASHPMSSVFERTRQPHHRQGSFSMGLGWFLSPLVDATEVWHTGGTGGAASYLGFVPDRSVGVVVLVNRALSLCDALLWNRVEHVGRKLLKKVAGV